MSNINEFVDLFKKISIDTFENSKPMNLVFGSVTSTSPFEVLLEQKISLDNSLLIGLQMCSCPDFKLVVGDRVALLRQQGGQKYLVLDKVVDL